ncbi:syntaphilin [Boleophthalmus pectinirostris]|uniref:syntaphilin n=1 Tax=Boleophthalmus pectinirostris TaxID=150288 RepID=UPI00242F22FB|nr:syntaphilin [Boleophthalmus pectinirostris]
MSLTPSRKQSSCQSRRSVGTSGSRYTQSDGSSTNTYPGRGRAVEGSPTARTHPSTPRRQAKYGPCNENHGIRVPTPEQYLTPLQQKEVCIRHLRARLRENTERLQHRDFEIDDLRTQLYRMQEEWIEGECHRVEAQLALKEARREIQHLQEVVETVRSNLGVRAADPHDNKPYTIQAARPGGRSRSCGCSPASTLSRNTTHKRMSTETLHPDPNGAARPSGQTHLLLEAALLSEHLPSQGGLLQTSPNVPHSSSFDRLCCGGALLPLSHSCHSLSTACRCNGHSYLPHHHLFLHLPQEEPPLTVTTTMSDPIPTSTAPSDRKTEVRSQACSPTMTWLKDSSVIEEISVISLSTTTDLPPSEPPTLQLSLPRASPIQNLDSVDSSAHHITKDQAKNTVTTVSTPQMTQPHSTIQSPDKHESTEADNKEESVQEDTERVPPQRYHWSRYFLVDLLALAMPVVPTMAWLCRGAPRDDMPVYHIGSLLRGCCAVALHSLRRQGAGRGGGGASNSLNGTT